MIMKPCTNHPPEEFLLDYATGSLPDAFALILATHACMCPACHQNIRALETLGGFLPMQASGEKTNALPTPAPSLPDTSCIPLPPITGWMGLRTLPSCLAHCMEDVPPPSAWPEILPGIRAFPLPSVDAKLHLLSFAKGVQAPNHCHDGLEMTLVLDGELQDGKTLFSIGDVATCDTGDCHAPKAGSRRNCLCLWATENDLVFL